MSLAEPTPAPARETPAVPPIPADKEAPTFKASMVAVESAVRVTPLWPVTVALSMLAVS